MKPKKRFMCILFRFSNDAVVINERVDMIMGFGKDYSRLYLNDSDVCGLQHMFI